MDNVTHALHGLGLYAVAATDPTIAQDPMAMSAVLWAASLGSQAPDFDFVIRLFAGDVAYLRHHRGISHSIPAWFLWPTFLAGVLVLFHPGHFAQLWWWSFLGVLVHVGMDLLTTYGTVAFWPLSKKRIGLDILMIIDVVLWVFGGIGIYLWLAGFPPQQVLLYTGLPSLLYILLRIGIHLYLRMQVRQRFCDDTVCRISIIPFLGLFRWNFVVEHHESYTLGAAHVRKGIRVDNSYKRVKEDDRFRPAAQSKVYGTFRWFARHLLLEHQEREDGHVQVNMADLAYRFRDRLPMTAHVVLDPEGNIVEERLGKKEVQKIAKRKYAK
ncbi:MAG TPA: metal-dependent hydrolase [Bacilli bacterium]|nr:metal-dependent hydrolase [Bacilli bacterium]